MADDTPNRVTVALVDAKVGQVATAVEGLKDVVRIEGAHTREAINDLKTLPAEVAGLRAEVKALDEREQEADADMDRRVSVIEGSRTRAVTWRVTAAISLGAAAIGGLIGHAHIPIP